MTRSRKPQQDATPPQILVVTHETSGDLARGGRKDDFCHAVDGEIVRMPGDDYRESVNDPGGRKRAMIGIVSGNSTTTMKVAALTGTAASLVDAFLEIMRRDGWLRFVHEDEARVMLADEVKELLRVASDFPLGTVVERRGYTFKERVAPAQK